GDGPSRLTCRVFRQSLNSDFGSKEPGGTGNEPETFTVALPKRILLWAPRKMQLFLVAQHRMQLISLRRGGDFAPVARREPRGASRQSAQAFPSRSQIAGRPDGRTFPLPE